MNVFGFYIEALTPSLIAGEILRASVPRRLRCHERLRGKGKGVY